MYRLRPRAKEDIKQIYTASRQHFGDVQAEKYYRALFAAFRKLNDYPNLGADYLFICEDIQGFAMQSHVIFYQRQGKFDIDMIRILHKRMDYQRYIDE